MIIKNEVMWRNLQEKYESPFNFGRQLICLNEALYVFALILYYVFKEIL